MRFRPLNNEAVMRACSKVARASEGSVTRLFGSPTLFGSSAKRIKYFPVLGLVEERLVYSR